MAYATHLNSLLSIRENQRCFDCGIDKVKHGVLTFGIFVCHHCSMRHQRYVSDNRLIKDLFAPNDWNLKEIQALEFGGNHPFGSFMSRYQISPKHDFLLKYRSRAALYYSKRLEYMIDVGKSVLHVGDYASNNPPPENISRGKQTLDESHFPTFKVITKKYQTTFQGTGGGAIGNGASGSIHASSPHILTSRNGGFGAEDLGLYHRENTDSSSAYNDGTWAAWFSSLGTSIKSGASYVAESGKGAAEWGMEKVLEEGVLGVVKGAGTTVVEKTSQLGGYISTTANHYLKSEGDIHYNADFAAARGGGPTGDVNYSRIGQAREMNSMSNRAYGEGFDIHTANTNYSGSSGNFNDQDAVATNRFMSELQEQYQRGPKPSDYGIQRAETEPSTTFGNRDYAPRHRGSFDQGRESRPSENKGNPDLFTPVEEEEVKKHEMKPQNPDLLDVDLLGSNTDLLGSPSTTTVTNNNNNNEANKKLFSNDYSSFNSDAKLMDRYEGNDLLNR